MAVADALLQFGSGLGETLRWSALQYCTGSGTVVEGLTWEYSGNDMLGATLTVTGTGSTFPEIPDGQFWKGATVCYEAIRDLKLEGLTHIGAKAFNNLKKLQDISAPTITDIGDYAFEGSKIRMPEFFPNLERVGIGAFRNGDLGGSWVFAGNVIIGDFAFEGSTLTYLDISQARGDIGNGVLKDCKDLTTFKASVVPEIPESFFEGCSALSSKGLIVSSWPAVIGARALFGCSSLDDSFISTAGMTSIGESAFEGSGVTAVILKEHADNFTLGASAFKDCKSLRTITWSPTLATMPNSIFEGCGVTSVEIPATVTKFGEACFRNCKSLTTVTYLGHAEAPSSVFEGCDALKDVTVPDDYQYDEFGGKKLNEGLSLGAKIGIGVGVAAFVIIVIVVVVVVLFVTGKIGGGKHDAEAVDA